MEKVVRIIEDCRDIENKATGKLGMYEGDFPLTVVFGCKPTDKDETDWKEGEYSYEAYRDGSLQLQNGRPVKEMYVEWERGKECPRPFFAMPMTNPRIRLEDGSHIWGCQCWWSPEIDTSLEQLQKEVDLFREVYAAMIAKHTTA